MSKVLTRSAKTAQAYMLCSLFIWKKKFNEKDPSGHPVLGEAPNYKGVPSLFKPFLRRTVITKDINLETAFTKFISLQLLGLERSPSLGEF